MTRVCASLSTEPQGLIQCCCSSIAVFEGNQAGASQSWGILNQDLFIHVHKRGVGQETPPLLSALLETITSSRDPNGPNIPASTSSSKLFGVFTGQADARGIIRSSLSRDSPFPLVSGLSLPCPHQADGAPSLVLEVLLAQMKRNMPSCP